METRTVSLATPVYPDLDGDVMAAARRKAILWSGEHLVAVKGVLVSLIKNALEVDIVAYQVTVECFLPPDGRQPPGSFYNPLRRLSLAGFLRNASAPQLPRGHGGPALIFCRKIAEA